MNIKALSLCMVTYTRNDEKLTAYLLKIIDELEKIIDDFEIIIYIENDNNIHREFELKNASIRNICGSKYIKLLDAIQYTNKEYIISIDNDIEANMDQFLNFVKYVLNQNYDLAWGKIYASTRTGLIPKLVFIDKLLSHDILRPFLWKINRGITIPGQTFIMKKKCFQDHLKIDDTFLDDLAVGICTIKNNLNFFMDHHVIAYEYPNTSFMKLVNQRMRWAKGFYQIFSSKKIDKSIVLLLCIHLTTYHLLSIFYLLFILFLFFSKPFSFLMILSIISFGIIKDRYYLFLYGILYQVIFPLFHIVWLYCFLKLMFKEFISFEKVD